MGATVLPRSPHHNPEVLPCGHYHPSQGAGRGPPADTVPVTGSAGRRASASALSSCPVPIERSARPAEAALWTILGTSPALAVLVTGGALAAGPPTRRAPVAANCGGTRRVTEGLKTVRAARRCLGRRDPVTYRGRSMRMLDKVLPVLEEAPGGERGVAGFDLQNCSKR